MANDTNKAKSKANEAKDKAENKAGEKAGEQRKTTQDTRQSAEETFRVESEKLVEKVKELIQQGNVRRIIVKDKNGKELVQFPLTIGLIGAVLAPMLAALGAIAALVTECTVTVQREE